MPPREEMGFMGDEHGSPQAVRTPGEGGRKEHNQARGYCRKEYTGHSHHRDGGKKKRGLLLRDIPRRGHRLSQEGEGEK